MSASAVPDVLGMATRSLSAVGSAVFFLGAAPTPAAPPSPAQRAAEVDKLETIMLESAEEAERAANRSRVSAAAEEELNAAGEACGVEVMC